MTCQDFLARHAEYVDDVMDPFEAAVWRDHAATCVSCMRYDRIVRQGVRLLRDLPTVEPSSDFFPRLQHRLYNLDEELRTANRSSGAGAVVSLAIAGVLAFLAWSPMLRLDQSLTTVRTSGASDAAVAELGEASQNGRTSGPAAAGRAAPTGDARRVQLAAEAGAGRIAEAAPDPERVADPFGVSEYGSGSSLVPLSDRVDIWWWSSSQPAAVVRSAPFIPSAHATRLGAPGPYSPLVVGVPAFRPVSVVRRTGGVLSRE